MLEKDIIKSLRQIPKMQTSYRLEKVSKWRIMLYAKKDDDLFIYELLKNLVKPKISFYMKWIVRERILAFINRKTLWESIKENIWNIAIKWALIPTLVASMFFVYIVWVNTTSAEIESKAIVVKWNAKIKHLWSEWKDINNLESLSIWDKIKTWNESLVEIYYYDNSVSRIAENSIISISSLSTDIYKTIPTVVKVENWRLWNQVVSSEHRFQVETDDAFVTAKNWAFDVKKNWTTEISAITQPIDVKILKEKKLSYETRVSAGYWIKSSNTEARKIINDKWRDENFIADTSYKKVLLDTIINNALWEVKILPDNKLYFAKKTFENLIDESNVAVIKKRLQELKILSFNNFVDLIDQNKQIISDILVLLNDEDQVFIAEFLYKELKKIELVLPWHNLYNYKIYISDLLLDLDKTWYYKKQLSILRLNEAQYIATSSEKDKKDLLVALSYFDWINSDIWDIENSTWAEKSYLKTSLTEKNDQLFLLQSIENSLKSEENIDIKKYVQQEKQEIASDVKKIMQELYWNNNIWNNFDSPSWTKDFSEKISLIADKINKYKSKRWKMNTLHWILEEMPNNQKSLTILFALKDEFSEPEFIVLISRKISKIQMSNK